jgi:cell division protein FtsZ
MGTAQATGPDRARIAAEQAVACPLLEGVDLSGAKGVLVLISAAKGSLKLRESSLAMNTIRNFASEDATVIYGTAQDDSLGESIRVTVVATGLARPGAGRVKPELKVMRTGTDPSPFYVPTLTPQAGSSMPSASLATASGSLSGVGMASGGYDDVARPTVWRQRDRTQAAAKVDALSSGGMEDFEIPAFLRKQAD